MLLSGGVSPTNINYALSLPFIELVFIQVVLIRAVTTVEQKSRTNLNPTGLFKRTFCDKGVKGARPVPAHVMIIGT
jgi:hypothetical protein